jgi:heme-degrading monooxygenase HmoA
MMVKVMIKRHIKEGKEAEVLELLKKLRFIVLDQEGYISGETLISTDNPLKLIVISTWESIDDWTRWRTSDARAQIESQLETLQAEPSLYESFVLSKYWLAVKGDGWKKRKEGVW